jgi:carbamoyltransferase
MSSIYGFFGGSHSPSTSLVVDGKIKYCVEEERLTRIKAGDNYDVVADLSSVFVEETSGLKILDADHRIFVEPVTDNFANRITKHNYDRVSHHYAHCYGAYFTSGMEGKVISLSHDGGGDFSIMKIFLCEDGKMTLVKNYDMSISGSLSHLWGFSTSGILGYDNAGVGIWRMCKDEGKLMGMAPDGFYDEELYKILNSCIDYKDLNFFPSATGSKVKFVMDTLKSKGYFETQKQREIFSFNLQKLTEDLFLKFLDDLHKLYPEYTKLSLSGGLFANVKLNQKINELSWVEEIYVYPPMGDEGLSLGACIFKSVELGEWTKPVQLKNVYFGKRYNNEEIFKMSKDYGFQRKEYDFVEMAQELNDGKILGWFQYGSEYGPRSLGARSILVRPTEMETHSLLNKRLGRHDTMPFAPIVLDEFFDDLFTCNKSKYAAEFMTICYSTKDEWIPKIPAVIQKSDKTARPQIVVKDKLPKFWNILKEYYKISGIPVLLNTSFNSHNEPIIENPKQSFESLKKGIIDKLIIEDYVYFP